MRLTKEELQRRFCCVKCHNHTCMVQEVALTSGALSRMLPVAANRHWSVSCDLCGYTEFYSLAHAVTAGKAARGELAADSKNS